MSARWWPMGAPAPGVLSLAALSLATLLQSGAVGQDAGPPPAATEDSPSTEGTRGTSAARRTPTKAARRRATARRAAASRRSLARRAAASRHSPPSAGRAASPDGTSVSIGRHNRGRLIHASELHESEVLRLKTPSSTERFGTDELVALLERVARAVAARTPGSRLTVGDLSRERGGRFRPHRSHQSGRDADVGFYTVDPDGAPLALRRFFNFRRDGTTMSDPTYRYDFARNWQLIEALVLDTEAPVQWVFIARELQVGLLAEGMRQGASEATITRATTIMSQPSRGGRHRDHFHVRIYCPVGDRPRCDDDPPFHPWFDRAGSAPSGLSVSVPEGASVPEGD